MEESALKTQARTELGRKAARRLRSQGLLPINVYGHKQANCHLVVDGREFERFIRQGHRMVNFEVDGESEHGVVKEIQYDSLGTEMIHVDIARVDLTESIELTVPVLTIGLAKGQIAGGTLDVALRELRVEGPAGKLPEKIEIKVLDLDVGDALRIKDLDLPQGCGMRLEGLGSAHVALHIDPDPDRPEELRIPIRFDGAPSEVGVLDTRDEEETAQPFHLELR